MSFSAELKRKLFHLLSLFYALFYALAGRELSLEALGGAFIALAAVEAVRLRRPGFNRKLMRLFGGIHRESEERAPSGILWTLLGCWLVIFFIPDQDIVVASISYLALGDAAASLVGKHWGKCRFGAKSLEGSLACFLACWAAGALLLSGDFGTLEVLWGALAATLIEASPLPLNDNLWMPLVPGLLLRYLRASAAV